MPCGIDRTSDTSRGGSAQQAAGMPMIRFLCQFSGSAFHGHPSQGPSGCSAKHARRWVLGLGLPTPRDLLSSLQTDPPPTQTTCTSNRHPLGTPTPPPHTCLPHMHSSAALGTATTACRACACRSRTCRRPRSPSDPKRSRRRDVHAGRGLAASTGRRPAPSAEPRACRHSTGWGLIFCTR